MIKFNLEKALNGAKVITRDGREVSQVTLFDSSNEEWPLCAVVGGEILSYSKDGSYISSNDYSELDLFMAPEILSGFVNVYDSIDDDLPCHATRDDADRLAMNGRIACIDLSQFPLGYGLGGE